MKNINSIKPEILAPAGDFVSLQAAIDAGADAVYFGIGAFNMRSGSTLNFTINDLEEIALRAKGRVKLYLTLNTIIFEDELAQVENLIVSAKDYVDAFIVSDWGVISLCKKYGVAIHASTQLSTSNSLAVDFLRSQGVSRVVLARECTLEEVSRITASSKMEIECFVHGAQCLAHSGRCLMSHVAFGKSANRGQCLQPCRRRFAVRAVEEGGVDVAPGRDNVEFMLEGHTILSAKDLCSIGFVDKLVEAGIKCFKIEGRARNANYVRACVLAYRRAVDAVFNGDFTRELVMELTKDLEKVFHREFSEGLFYGRPGVGLTTDSEDSLATTLKRHVGVVVDYFAKAGVAQIKVQDSSMSKGDCVQIHGNTTGVVELVVGEMRRDEETVDIAERGSWVTMPAPKCRRGDKVFLICDIN